MSNRLKGFITLGIIVGLPLIIVLFLKQGKPKLHKLPIYGPKEVNQNGDTSYFKITDTLFSKMQDEMIILHFFDYSNIEVSDKTDYSIVEMYEVGRSIRDVKNIRILSLTEKSNPILDTLTRQKYWIYKDMDTLQSFIENSIKHNYILSNNFISDGIVVLLDKERRIRGYYRSKHSKFKQRLLSEIIVLHDEQK